jgi:hypothetical protein
MLKTFLGTDNASSVSLQELCDGDYSSGWLYGKLANLYADLEDKALKSTGRFKILTGEDSITSNVKYGQPITFTNSAKMIFSANKIPSTYDDTDAFYRRWVILHFARTFTDKEANKNLIKELTTPEEMSGLLNEALKALKAMLDRGYFSCSKTTEDLRIEYTRLSDPVGAFILDCVEQGDANDLEAKIRKDDVFNAYISYCKDRRLNRKNEVWFWKDFRNRIVCNFYRDKKTSTHFVLGLSLTFASSTPKEQEKEQYTIDNEQCTLETEELDRVDRVNRVNFHCSNSEKNHKEEGTKNTLSTMDTVESSIFEEDLTSDRGITKWIETELQKGNQELKLTATNKNIDALLFDKVIEDLKSKGYLIEYKTGFYKLND